MTKKILYDPDRLKFLIQLKYGSVDKYAELKNTTRQNIYQKIKTQKGDFIRELIKDGFNEALIYNYIHTDKIEANQDTLEIIIGLKSIIDYQKNLLEMYERAIIELRNDYDNLRKSKLTKID